MIEPIINEGTRVMTPAGPGAVREECQAILPGESLAVSFYWVAFDSVVEFLGRSRPAAWFTGEELQVI